MQKQWRATSLRLTLPFQLTLPFYITCHVTDHSGRTSGMIATRTRNPRRSTEGGEPTNLKQPPPQKNGPHGPTLAFGRVGVKSKGVQQQPAASIKILTLLVVVASIKVFTLLVVVDSSTRPSSSFTTAAAITCKIEMGCFIKSKIKPNICIRT